MRGSSFYFAIIFMGVICGCSSQQKENEKLHSEVIAIHDEVMPVMGKVKSIQKTLMDNAAELTLEDSLSHEEQINSLKNTATELDKAYNNMFVWMRQFNTEYEKMTAEEVNIYLKQQKEKVKKVNVDIKNALAKAEEMND
jgi:hypothetical protein